MENIKINSIEELKKLLKNINEDGDYRIELDDGTCFYAICDDAYDLLSCVKDIFNEEETRTEDHKIKVISNDMNQELSFEQFEILKKQINEALDKTLKPKPEKLN